MRLEKKIDDLTIEVWGFYINGNTIYLDYYTLFQKESKRKRTFKPIKYYSRLRNRESTITESEVPFTDEIKKDALDKYIETLRVLKWSERDNKF